MVHKLIDIPNNQLDEIINNYIDESHEIVIIVSFIFEKGIYETDKEMFFRKVHNIIEVISFQFQSIF